MPLLLDTNILLRVAEFGVNGLPLTYRQIFDDPGGQMVYSVASLWEVAIKHRSGKLPLPCTIEQWPLLLEALSVEQIGIEAAHVIAEVGPWPDTKDPFDRLLLATCAVEHLRLVTIDRLLVDHPLAWRPSAA